MKTPLLVRFLCLAAGLCGASTLLAQAAQVPQLAFPALSPESTIKQRIGFTDIEVVYSRPSAKGRRIIGVLVPQGEIWRTGANTATKITFSTPVKIGGQTLPAGAYGLFSIPGAQEWTIIFNKVTGEWGAYTYKAEADVLRVKAKPVAISPTVETFLIDFNDIRPESATLNLIWEQTRVPLKFEVDVVAPVRAQVEAVMATGAKLPPATLFNAALFYYDNNLDMNKAKGWIEEATAGNAPQFFMVHLKAKILARLGDKAGAIAAARQSIALADGAAKAEYIRLNEAVIEGLK